MLRRAAFLAVLMISLCASGAQAAPQIVDDPDDGVAEAWFGKQVDARQVRVEQNGDQTTVSVAVEPPYSHSAAESDHVLVFMDANGDGLSEHGIAFSGFSQTPYHWAVVSTPASQPGCQRFAGGAPTIEGDTEVPAAQDGLVTLTATFPTSAIGGATSFRWGVYALNDSLQTSTYDYVPDAANPRTPSSAAATQNMDGCDTNGDGTYGGSDDERTSVDGSYPLDLTKGIAFPPSDPGDPQDPIGPVVTTETMSVAGSPRMPRVTGLGLDAAVQKLQKAGINAIVVKRPDTRKLSGKQPGVVLRQSPRPRRRIPTGATPFDKVVLNYYLGPVKASKDGCAAKALTRALEGEDPAVTQAYLDRYCDEVGVRYKFSSRVTEAELTRVGEPGAELRVICRDREDENGQEVEYCDVVRVPPDTEKVYYQVPCEFDEKKRELKCSVVKKRRDKPKDQNDVVGVVTVPKNADDLLLAVGDAEEFTKDNPGVIGFTSNWRFLTTNQYQLRYTCIRTRVMTAKGELVTRARVALAVPAGMSPDVLTEQRTNGTQGVYFCLRLLKPGKVHLVATATGNNGGVIHGVKTIKVEELTQERTLLDDRRIRPSTKYNGTQLYEVVNQQQLRHEAQIATGGGQLAAAPMVASTTPGTIGVARGDNTLSVHTNVPVVPPSQLTQGVQGSATDNGVSVAGIGNYGRQTDVSKGPVFDSQLTSSIISNNSAKIISDNGGGLIGDHGTGLIGQAGGNLISDKGLGLIGQAGGN